jgi:2-oxoglutarate dehydrogenase complex dehydrogenase (E1) component-like enzyme
MHLIVNNQLGFTTDAHKGRSTSYSSDIGRSVHTPAIHVNAEDPEAVVRATRIAMDYIRTWKRDVILDLNGYRRHGHNELDEPAFTQPLMYNNIRARPSIVTSYADKLVVRGCLPGLPVLRRRGLTCSL